MLIHIKKDKRYDSLHYIKVGIGICLIVTPLALGGAHPETNLILALLTLTGLGLWARRQTGTVILNIPILLMAIALGATLIQLLPMPVILMKYIAPGAFDTLRLVFENKVQWAPLTMDIPATSHEFLKCVIAMGASILAANLFTDLKEQKRLLQYIAIAGSVVMTLGLLHTLVGFQRPYNFFGQHLNFFNSSFINPNHLAGFLGFCSLLMLGLALTAQRFEIKWLYFLGALLIGAGVILSLSRGGVVCYVGALLLLTLLLSAQRRLAWQRHFLAVQLLLIGSLVAAAYLAYTQIVHELWTLSADNAFNKTEVWQAVGKIIADFPFFGIGRGAFSGVYTRYRLDNLPATYSHLENEWLQLWVDWGPGIGLLLCLGVLICLTQLLRKSIQSPLLNSVIAALVFVGIHNIGDFNLTLSAVLLPVVLVLSAFCPPLMQLSLKKIPQVWINVLLTVGIVCVLLNGTMAIQHNIDRDTKQWIQNLSRLSYDTLSQERELLWIHRLHPSDYVLPLLTGEFLLKQNASSVALPWINQGLYLAPASENAHILAARALHRSGFHTQAWLEYSLACKYGPSRVLTILDEIWSLSPNPATIAKIDCASSSVPASLSIIHYLISKKAPALALQKLEKLSPKIKTHVQGQFLKCHILSDLKRLSQALTCAQAVEKMIPEQAKVYILQNSILIKQGELQQALVVLERGLEQARKVDAVLSTYVYTLLRMGEWKRAEKSAKKLLEYAGLGYPMAGAHALLARIYYSQKKYVLALKQYQLAQNHAPKQLEYRLHVANLMETLGNLNAALNELNKAEQDLGFQAVIQERRSVIEEKQKIQMKEFLLKAL